MEELNKHEISIPKEYRKTRILLIDPDMASVMHTTSVLEEATFRVTSTEYPNVALSILQERATGFRLLIASMEMQGMDCLTFIKTVKTLSDIPVALTSHKTQDWQLATRIVQGGVCQFFSKPITIEDARGLWQYMRRKERSKTGNDVNNHSDSVQPMLNSKGKSKDFTIYSESEVIKTKNKKHIKVLRKEVIPPTGPEAFGITELASLTRAKLHLQNSNTGSPTRTNSNSSNGIRQMQMTSNQEIVSPCNNLNATSARNNFQIPGATRTNNNSSNGIRQMQMSSNQEIVGNNPNATSAWNNFQIPDATRTNNNNPNGIRQMQMTSNQEIVGPYNNPNATSAWNNFQIPGATRTNSNSANGIRQMQMTSNQEIVGPCNNPNATSARNNFQISGATRTNSNSSNGIRQMQMTSNQEIVGPFNNPNATSARNNFQIPGATRTNCNSANGIRQMQMTSNPNATSAQNNFQIPGAISSLQSNYAANSSASGYDFFSVPNNFPEYRTNYGNSSLCGAGKELAPFCPHLRVPINTALNIGKSGIIEGSSSMNQTSFLSNTNNKIATNVSTDNLRGRIDQIRRAYRTPNKTISGKSTSLPGTQQLETSEHKLLGAKRMWSQYDHVSSDDVSNITELVSKRATTFGSNVIPNYRFSSSQCGYLSEMDTNGYKSNTSDFKVPFTSSENYVQSIMQNSSNSQMDTRGILQTSNKHPTIYGFNNNSFFRPEGFTDQGVNRTPIGVGARRFEGIKVIDSSAEILKNADTSNSQQPNEDDMFLDEILAELRCDYANNDLKSLGFKHWD